MSVGGLPVRGVAYPPEMGVGIFQVAFEVGVNVSVEGTKQDDEIIGGSAGKRIRLYQAIVYPLQMDLKLQWLSENRPLMPIDIVNSPFYQPTDIILLPFTGLPWLEGNIGGNLRLTSSFPIPASPGYYLYAQGVVWVSQE